MLRPPHPPASSSSSSSQQQQQQQLPNSSLANSVNGLQNPIQNQAPFCNPNAHMNNLHGNPVPNMPPPMFQPGMMMNMQNPFMALHNNPLGASPFVQGHMGFANPAANFQAQGQFNNLVPGVNQMNMNSCLPLAQFFGQNMPNLVQQLNQNMGLSNGQFCLPFQNMNQHVIPGQMMNMSSQVPPHTSYGGPNQQAVSMAFQNPALSTIQPFGVNQAMHPVNQNPQNFIPQGMGGAGSNQLPGSAQPLQGNSTMPFNTSNQPLQGNSNMPFNSSTQPLQGNLNMPFKSSTQPLQGNSTMPFNSSTQPLQGNSTMPFNSSTQPQQARNLQSPAFVGSQGNSSINDGGNGPNSFSNNLTHRNNFTRNSNKGFQKNQTQHMKNEKKKFGFPGGQKGKGFHNERRNKFGGASFTDQVKGQTRSLSLVYTEQEIRQWREARRKNFPSSTNIQKKLTEKQTDCTLVDKEAQLLRQELKEILAKQAELGVEVAEIPPEYLSYSEKCDNRKQHRDLPIGEEAEGASTGKEKSRNKFNKRGRPEKKNRSRKKGKSEQHLSNTTPLNKREPTLLQKLLKSDVKREKSQLLQTLRFMVMNSFFKELPNKPLKFPSVMVKEKGGEINVVDEKKSLSTGSFNLQETNNSIVENNGSRDIDCNNENDDGNNDNDNDNDEKLKGGDGIQVLEEEEGEIID